MCIIQNIYMLIYQVFKIERNSLNYKTFKPKERVGIEKEGDREDADNGTNTNSFPSDIHACEKSVRFIKFRENVGTPTNSPAWGLWHPSIVFLGTPINIYEHGRAT